MTFTTEKVVDYQSYCDYQDAEMMDLAWLYEANRGIYAAPGRDQEFTISVQHSLEDADRYAAGLRRAGRRVDGLAPAGWGGGMPPPQTGGECHGTPPARRRARPAGSTRPAGSRERAVTTPRPASRRRRLRGRPRREGPKGGSHARRRCRSVHRPGPTRAADRARASSVRARASALAGLHERARGSLLAGVPLIWMTAWRGDHPVFFAEARGVTSPTSTVTPTRTSASATRAP